MDADSAARLMAAVDRLGETDTERSVHEVTARTAADLLSVPVTVVASREGDRLRPRWVVSERLLTRELVRTDTSVAGETLRTGEVVVVDDLHERGADAPPAPGAGNGELRSALSVPLDGDSVLQALSPTTGRFTAGDARLTELLAAQAEQALRRVRTEQEARQERDDFVALFDNVVDGAVRYRLEEPAEEPVVERVNPAFVDRFGVEAETLLGQPMTALPFVDDDGEELRAARRGRRVERRVTRSTDAGRHRFLMRTVPVDDPDREAAVGYVIYTDIEESVSRAERLRRQNERLDEFASTVTHDLRNPLEVASGYLAAAQGRDDDVDVEDETQALAEVEAALDRMDRIIEDVLAMTRQGQAVVETDTVSLATVAREAWGNVATDDASLRVAADVTLDADRSRLAQLLENLFRNSVEHGSTGNSPGASDPDGPGEPSVAVVVGPLSDRPGFYVADDGPGIPPDRREQALEPGYTTAADGTGLGLSLVDRIAGAHGWDVDLDAADGGGLRVVVRTAGGESAPAESVSTGPTAVEWESRGLED